MAELTAANRRPLLVRSMTWESDGVMSFDLVDPAGGDLAPWQPGAHIDVDCGGHERQYSLCGDPAERRRYTVAALREPQSRGGSQWLHTAVRPGDTVIVGGPRNSFELVPGQRYLFIAGGIGITPILPMIEAVQAQGADWRLLYGGRRRASMAFTERLSRYGERVTLWPQDEYGLLDLATELAPRQDTLVYCCGPEPLLAAVEARCVDWPTGSLKVERFAPKPPTAAQIEARALDQVFEVVLARAGRSFMITPDMTILDTLEAAGIAPDSSCQEGTCGTCETAVIEGLPDHRDSILDDEDRAANETMMICVSRSLGPRLVLDL